MTAEKVQIVRENAETYGLNTTLEAIGLPKSTWYYWKSSKVDYEEKYKLLKEPLIEVLTANPAYGYRRVEPELKDRGYQVGETVVQRVLGMWNLSLRRWMTKPKPSVPRKLLNRQGNGMNLVAGMDVPEPLQVLYTDFMEILVRTGCEEGIPDAVVGSRDEVGGRLVGGASSKHGAGVGSSLHGTSDAR